MERNTYVYVSSWDKHASKENEFGLNGYAFDRETGELRWIEKVEDPLRFNVMHFDRRRRLLYALEESDDLPGLRGGGGGRVFVFRVASDTGKLTKIGCTETWCASPCYLTLDQSGRFLLIAHHGGNAVVTKIAQDPRGAYYPILERDDVAVELFSVKEDGTLDTLLDVAKHYGDGPERRQAHARPHTVVMDPSGKLFAVCDKGNDTVRMYGLDQENGKLIRPRHIYSHPAGTLPRYCVFHPKKPWFYHNNENTACVNGFVYSEDGLLRENGVFHALPDAPVMQEDICEQQGLVMDHDGRYLYDIIRGPNVVAVFEVDQNDGSLHVIQHQPISGRWPRGCALSSDGRFLLVCCLEGGKVVEFSVHGDGRLSETGREYPNAAASNVIFCELET
jgi:6-phosphogluconolactonase (cycloisomerase 2 family)